MSIKRRLASLESKKREGGRLENLSDAELDARISDLTEQLAKEATGETATISQEAIEARKAGTDTTAIDARLLAAIRMELHVEGISI